MAKTAQDTRLQAAKPADRHAALSSLEVPSPVAPNHQPHDLQALEDAVEQRATVLNRPGGSHAPDAWTSTPQGAPKLPLLPELEANKSELPSDSIGTPLLGSKGQAYERLSLYPEHPQLGAQGRRLSAAQFYQNFQTLSRSGGVSEVVMEAGQFESMTREEFYRYISDPLAKETFQGLCKRIEEMSESDITPIQMARALILAEPAEAIDRAFPRVHAGMSLQERRSTREAQAGELLKRYNQSSELFSRVFTALENQPERYAGLSKNELWRELQKTAFGTEDAAEIASKFSREERRGTRLALLNLIETREDIQHATKEITGETKSGLHRASRAGVEKLLDCSLPGDEPIHVEVLPHGLVLYLKEADYLAAHGGLSAENSYGCALCHESLPEALKGKVVLLRCGPEDELNLFGGSGISLAEAARIKPGQYAELQIARRHELSHAVFNSLNSTHDFFTPAEFEIQLSRITKLSTHCPAEQRLAAEMDLHRQLSGKLGEFFSDRARDEFVSYRRGGGSALNETFGQLGLEEYGERLLKLKKWLGERTELKPQEKQNIFELYRTKQDQVLTGFHAFRCFARKLLEDQNLPQSVDQRLALLQQTPINQRARLMRFFGCSKNEFEKPLHAAVLDAARIYQRGRHLEHKLHLLLAGERKGTQPDGAARADAGRSLAQFVEQVKDCDRSPANAGVLAAVARISDCLEQGKASADVFKALDSLGAALAGQHDTARLGSPRNALKAELAKFITSKTDQGRIDGITQNLKLYGDSLSREELSDLAQNVRSRRMHLSAEGEQARLGKLLAGLQYETRKIQASRPALFDNDMPHGDKTAGHLSALLRRWSTSHEARDLSEAVRLAPGEERRFWQNLPAEAAQTLAKAGDYTALTEIVRKAPRPQAGAALEVLINNLENLTDAPVRARLANLVADRMVFSRELFLSDREKQQARTLLDKLLQPKGAPRSAGA